MIRALQALLKAEALNLGDDRQCGQRAPLDGDHQRLQYAELPRNDTERPKLLDACVTRRVNEMLTSVVAVVTVA